MSTLLNYVLTKKYLSLDPPKLTELYQQSAAYNSSRKFDGHDKIDQNNLLLLEFHLALLTCHDIEAKTALDRICDLIGDDSIVDTDSQWLIFWRSVFLQCESEANGHGSSSSVIYDYINEAAEKLVKGYNRKMSQSITAAGDPEKVRDTEDLYVLQKRVTSMKSHNTVEYVNKLLALIDLRPLDWENWCELAEVYVSQGEIEKAHHCYMEVLIGMPMAYNIWARVGELTLTLAKLQTAKKNGELLKCAIQYFSRSVELCELYTRGWCGLYVALQRLEDENQYDGLRELVKTKLADMQDKKVVSQAERDNIKWILSA